jgi:hypothetical protein
MFDALGFLEDLPNLLVKHILLSSGSVAGPGPLVSLIFPSSPNALNM